MRSTLQSIPHRILELAKGALAQANTHAVFSDPGFEHREFMCVVNTAHAGELVLKAIIAAEHPLLVFRDLFALDDNRGDILDVETLIRRGKTHDFDKLPQVLWAVTGRRVPNMECFERLRLARNAIQHFVAPEEVDFRSLSLEFIYTIIDPLMNDAFGLCAIEYHEDVSIGYDYVVARLLRANLKFSVPSDFRVSEISLMHETSSSPTQYVEWLKSELRKAGRLDLFE